MPCLILFERWPWLLPLQHASLDLDARLETLRMQVGPELAEMVGSMLQLDASTRPSLDELLALPVVKSHIPTAYVHTRRPSALCCICCQHRRAQLVRYHALGMGGVEVSTHDVIPPWKDDVEVAHSAHDVV